ncbi:MAG: MarR family transcriptional regulator [Marinicaulis sp.]|nr:MarR family transcriptional regulator [Marinicaulis sp.]
MTEIIEKRPVNTIAMELSPIDRFILHWGDLGASWGVNRSVAQIQALLLVSERPLNAEEIATRLKMARSNVSNSVKELTTWNLIRRAPIRGDRCDHFEAVGDAWEMARRILEMRKAREIDPAKTALAACLEDVRKDSSVNGAAVERLESISELMTMLDDWYAQIRTMPKEQLVPMIKLGAKAVEILKPFIGKEGERKA